MGWRSVIISNPSQIKLENYALVVSQDAGIARLALEDLSVIVLETPQIVISGAAISACVDAQIAIITTDGRHMPSGVLVPFQSHSRPLRVLRGQVDLGLPVRKRVWQRIVQSKISNQADVLRRAGQLSESQKLAVLIKRVASGDPANIEARAAQSYFRSLFGKDFARHQDRLINSALDYGYAVVRAAVARDLAVHGFITALGLFHRSELNAYNLADDLLEPYRPIVDAEVYATFSGEDERNLLVEDKARLVSLLHKDVVLCRGNESTGARTVLAAIRASVMSLSSIVLKDGAVEDLQLPFLAHDVVAEIDDDDAA